jgi:prepilin-type processing-associated H-X9-DG protein
VNTVVDWPISGWNGSQKFGFRDPAGPAVGQSVHEARVEDPSGTIWVVDGDNLEMWQETTLDYAPNQKPNYQRHSEGFSAVFGDGHAKWMKAGSTRASAWSIQAD